ncbi:MAG: hypothetical protein AAGC93_10385 [Cyanobacteria bacterium P01_F01_bin.53]
MFRFPFTALILAPMALVVILLFFMVDPRSFQSWTIDNSRGERL